MVWLPEPMRRIDARPVRRPHCTAPTASDLRHLVEGVLLVIAALLPIVNPFGGAPVFLAMTADCTAELRAGSATPIIPASAPAAAVCVCYRCADRMLRVLGETGASVLIRISAFVLPCIGVQIFWTSASALLATLPAPV